MKTSSTVAVATLAGLAVSAAEATTTFASLLRAHSLPGPKGWPTPGSHAIRPTPMLCDLLVALGKHYQAAGNHASSERIFEEVRQRFPHADTGP